MRKLMLVLVCLLSFQSTAWAEDRPPADPPRTEDRELEGKLRTLETEFSRHLGAQVRITEAKETWWNTFMAGTTKSYRLRLDVKKGAGLARLRCRASEDLVADTLTVAIADCEWVYKAGEKKVGRLSLGAEDKVLTARPIDE